MMHVVPALRDGMVLALGACGTIVFLLATHPRLFLRHFPESVRAGQPPKTVVERRIGAVAGLILAALVLGILIISAHAAAPRLGDAFLPLFAHTFTVATVFNVADWLLIDMFWLGLLRGAGLSLPGVTVQDIPFEAGKHALDFCRGSLAFAVLAALIAGGVILT